MARVQPLANGNRCPSTSHRINNQPCSRPQMEVNLYWIQRQSSSGSTSESPPCGSIASENSVIAQKAMFAIYGGKNSGNYPNGVCMRFSLLIHAAYNMNSKAKLENDLERDNKFGHRNMRKVSHGKSCNWIITLDETYLPCVKPFSL